MAAEDHNPAEFQYFAGEQRSPEWFKLRLGKVTASKLKDWLAVSKGRGNAKVGAGAPLKGRLDYEKELMFERQFGVSFENFVSKAMQDGIDFETFVIEQYEKQTGTTVYAVGGWYNDFFMASPDGGIGNPEDVAQGIVEGIVEVKVLKDTKFTAVLMADPSITHNIPNLDEKGEPVVDAKGKPVPLGTSVLEDHWKQVQGQLRATKTPLNPEGAKYCDYIPANLNTKKFKVVRVYPDMEFKEFLDLSVQEKLVVSSFAEDKVFDFVDSIPERLLSSSLSDEEIADF